MSLKTFSLSMGCDNLGAQSRACLKIVIIPKRWLFFPHTLPIFLGIHQVFLRQIGFVWRKDPSPLGTFPIFKQRLIRRCYMAASSIYFSTPHERPSQLRMKIRLVRNRAESATLEAAGEIRLHLGESFTPFVQRGRIAQENSSM